MKLKKAVKKAIKKNPASSKTKAHTKKITKSKPEVGKAKSSEGVENKKLNSENPKTSETDKSKLSKEAEHENGEKTQDQLQNEKIENLTKMLEESMAKDAEEAPAEHPPAAAPAEAAPAAAPAAPAHAPSGPPQDVNTELQTLAGKVAIAQQTGQNPAQARQELQAKYQQAGGDQSKQINPQTKQTVQAILGTGGGQAMGGMNSGMMGGINGNANGMQGIMGALNNLLGPATQGGGIRF